MLCSSSEVNSGLFLSVCLLPETKVAGMSSSCLFTGVMWAFTCPRVSRGCLEFEKSDRLVGVIALEKMN